MPPIYFLTIPDVKRQPYHTKPTQIISMRIITGLSRLYLNIVLVLVLIPVLVLFLFLFWFVDHAANINDNADHATEGRVGCGLGELFGRRKGFLLSDPSSSG